MDEIMIQFFPNMTVWKLHSFKEYLIFFLLLLSGFLFFHGWINRLRKARTPSGAKKRVLKAVKTGSHDRYHYFPFKNGGLSPESTCILLPHDVLLLRIISKGYQIKGSEYSEQWLFKDNSESISIPNPLTILEHEKDKLENLLKTAKIAFIRVHIFVIAADNYAAPVFYLDGPSRSKTLSLPELKQWIRQRELDPLPEEKQQEILALLQQK